MKKLLLSVLLAGGLSASAQTALSETFQGTTFPPTGWTTATGVSTRPWGFTTDVFNATGQTTFNITGGKSAAIGWIAQDNDAHLTSPSFSLVGYTDASFAFNTKIGYEYMVSPFPSGDLFAKVSINGGTSWTTLWVEEDEGVFADYATLAITLDLTPYVGQANVMVRFQYVGNDADSVSVDDVVVSGTLGLNDVISSKFSTFPNPVKDIINLRNAQATSVSNITVTDINGRIIKNLEVDNLSEVQINVSELNAGIYFMNITSDSGKAVKKFIKS
ncbi:T9SS type A sorting domain-containing protein [Flavobacterium sp.]|uniref:T9SS type A sorting domain-containing protein n=1 Tax=Flavobacterium sp. TaxID=239 RepID=UPI0037536846